jgi:signal transduction histidine kinase
LFKEIEFNSGSANTLHNIAMLYDMMGEQEKALPFLYEALDILLEENNKIGIAYTYQNLGIVYFKSNQMDKSLENFQKCLPLFEEMGTYFGLASVYSYKGKIYLAKNQLNQAEINNDKCLEYTKLFNGKGFFRDAYKVKAEIAFKRNQFKDAYIWFTKSAAYVDSVYSEDKNRAITEMQTKYETEKKEQENTILKHKNEFNELVISRQNSLRNFLIIILLIIAISMILVYNQYRLKKIAFHELEQADNLIQKQRDELELMNQTRNQFFSIVSHDLKNSFTSLQMGAKMLSNIENFEKDELKMISKEIREIVDNLYKLLENLLEWARLQIGKTHHEPEIIDFSDIINDVIKILAKKAEQKQLQIISEVIDCYVFADKNMLYSILQNLIFNAIKFSLPQGIIKIKNKIENAQVEIIVSDNGIGMDREKLENLFKLEKMHSQKGTDDEKGTGLGLILCKEFVEKNNGEIWVESEAEKGTSVHIILPNKEI